MVAQQLQDTAPAARYALSARAAAQRTELASWLNAALEELDQLRATAAAHARDLVREGEEKQAALLRCSALEAAAAEHENALLDARHAAQAARAAQAEAEASLSASSASLAHEAGELRSSLSRSKAELRAAIAKERAECEQAMEEIARRWGEECARLRAQAVASHESEVSLRASLAEMHGRAESGRLGFDQNSTRRRQREDLFPPVSSGGFSAATQTDFDSGFEPAEQDAAARLVASLTADLAQEREQYAFQLQAAALEVEAAQIEAHRCASDADRYRDALASAEQSLAAEHSRVVTLQEEVAEAQRQRTDALKSASKMDAEIALSMVERDRAAGELREARAEAQRAAEGQRSAHEALLSSQRAVHDALAALEAERTSAEAVKRRAAEGEAAHSRALAASEARAQSAEAGAASARAEAASRDPALARMSAELRRADASLAALRSEHEALCERCHALQAAESDSAAALAAARAEAGAAWARVRALEAGRAESEAVRSEAERRWREVESRTVSLLGSLGLGATGSPVRVPLGWEETPPRRRVFPE
jgi:chromosome segregation ATPase